MPWFEVTKIDESTYCISENQHWEETHCYLLIGTDKALLIDTGLGIENIKPIIQKLTSLPIEVVLTHVHWDHIGGIQYFDNIMVHNDDKSWLLDFPLTLQEVKRNLTSFNQKFPPHFKLENYHLHLKEATTILLDKDIIKLGDRDIRVIHTPGHSPGHICLYEEHKGYLYTGDLVYAGKLDMFYPSTCPHDYLQSIKKLEEIHVNTILPGHHTLDLNPDIIHNIAVELDGLLHNPTTTELHGIFKFNGFSIHL